MWYNFLFFTLISIPKSFWPFLFLDFLSVDSNGLSLYSEEFTSQYSVLPIKLRTMLFRFWNSHLFLSDCTSRFNGNALPILSQSHVSTVFSGIQSQILQLKTPQLWKFAMFWPCVGGHCLVGWFWFVWFGFI